MKKNELINKTLAGLMIAAMTAGVCPTTAFAVTGETIAADNTYTKTVKIEPDEDGEFKAYDVQVSLTVKDGKFSDITVTPVGNVDRKNQSYMNDARDGWGDSVGYSSLVGKAATEDTVNAWDIVSGATCTSKTVKSALVSAINDAPSATVEVNTANLEAAIAKAKGLTAADYTAESWAKLQTALTAADAALTAKESQDAVDTVAGNLNTAIDALAKKPEEVKVNTEKLEAAIAKADALKDKEADYTAKSWKTMQTALTEAKAALEAKESQDKVDAAETKLTKTIDALEKNAVAKEVYVLMNIPYDKFYAAEGVDYADAVTSATLNKTRSSLAAGSYHVSSDGSDITGIVYPVKLEDASALNKLTQVTDSSKVDITVSMKGKETTTTYEGKDALFESHDVLIVDNNSNDGTGDMVSTIQDKRVKYYNTGKNLGGAGGFAFGLKKAIELGYQYAWIMDDDSIPEKDALMSLVNKGQAINGEFSYLASLVYWTDGNLFDMNVPDFQYNSRLGLGLDMIRRNKLLLIDTCSFVGCFVNLKYAETAGLPISEFFIYGDDQEYTARLRKLAPAYLDFDSVIVHKAPSNKGADVVSADETRIERFFYQARNGMYIARKNGKVGHRLRVVCGRIKNILCKAPDHKAKRVWVTCKGTISGFFFNPEIEYAHRKGE